MVEGSQHPVRRLWAGRWWGSGELWTSVGAVMMALIIGGLLIAGHGVNPFLAYGALIQGAFGSVNSLGETVARMCPLLLAGLAVTLAFQAGLWNIGAEGQLYLGALAATWGGLTFSGLPAYLLLPLMILGGFVGGAVWGAVPGLLKAKFGANEIINTIMMNFIAIYLIGYLLTGPLQEADKFFPRSDELTAAAQLPILLPRTRLHAGILLALLSAWGLSTFNRRTVLGYEFRVAGHSLEAARFGRIPVERNIVLAMVLSGGVAGLAGMVEIAGIHHLLLENISAEFGYTAIAVALLGRIHPLGVVVAAFLFAALDIGASTMQSRMKVPAHIVTVVQGLIVVFVVGRAFFLHQSWLSRLLGRVRTLGPIGLKAGGRTP